MTQRNNVTIAIELNPGRWPPEFLEMILRAKRIPPEWPPSRVAAALDVLTEEIFRRAGAPNPMKLGLT